MHLIAFSHRRWTFFSQRPQQLLSRLARELPVVFVEEPMHDEGPARLERWRPAPGVEVLQPHTPVAAPGFHDDQLPMLQPLLAQYLREQGIAEVLAWFCTPMALPLVAELDPRGVIYDCVDELSADRRAPRQMRQREAALLRCAQLVLTAGPALFEAKQALHPNVMCLPGAVDAHAHAPGAGAARLELILRAEQVQGRIPGPRLGCFGVVDDRIDMDLLTALADAEPDWQIVMAGPIVGMAASRLPQRANIHWLGDQPHALLPQLVADWDVCLLPFALDESTRFLNPSTTLEYMAAEKPIVSTALPDVVAMHGDVVRIARDAPAFIESCRWALSETPCKRAERIGDMLATVSRASWDAVVETVREAIEGAVATPSAQARAVRAPMATPIEAPRVARAV
ncbi:MAG TPA: glycosyltransferase [Albitalea sp.]|uniref:glycosyltransferase n=1 Tax=Piscinibacter sp. TaxID=1903157 RepID=UPI002ECFEED5